MVFVTVVLANSSGEDKTNTYRRVRQTGIQVMEKSIAVQGSEEARGGGGGRFIDSGQEGLAAGLALD